MENKLSNHVLKWKVVVRIVHQSCASMPILFSFGSQKNIVSTFYSGYSENLGNIQRELSPCYDPQALNLWHLDFCMKHLIVATRRQEAGEFSCHPSHIASTSILLFKVSFISSAKNIFV